MAKKLNRVPKAVGKPLNQAWLILSKSKERFEERVALIDLFIPDTVLKLPNDENLASDERRAKLAEHFWSILTERGFKLNSHLEYQYQKQQACIWCGGPVITYSNGDPDSPSWEARCADCNYLYDED